MRSIINMNTVSILNTNKDSLFQKILKTFDSLFFSIYMEISQELMAPALVPNAPIGLIYALDSRDFNTPACQATFRTAALHTKKTSTLFLFFRLDNTHVWGVVILIISLVSTYLLNFFN